MVIGIGPILNKGNSTAASALSAFGIGNGSKETPKYVAKAAKPAKPAPKTSKYALGIGNASSGVPKSIAKPAKPVKKTSDGPLGPYYDQKFYKPPPITDTGSVEEQILGQLKDKNITGNPDGGGGGNGGGNGGGSDGGSDGGDAALGLQETYANDAADNAYRAAQAMRTFQRDQAGRQLTDALGTIDRAAIEGYKGIGNDYAARGLSRSGGYAQREDMAMADKTRADKQSNQAVQDFLDQLDLQGTADLEKLGTTKQQILADFLARRFAKNGG
jgi:hypothetical protein